MCALSISMADAKGGLIGLIADEVRRSSHHHCPVYTAVMRVSTRISMQDTISGFLLAGVGNSDVRKRTNYLVVDASAYLLPMLAQAT